MRKCKHFNHNFDQRTLETVVCVVTRVFQLYFCSAGRCLFFPDDDLMHLFKAALCQAQSAFSPCSFTNGECSQATMYVCKSICLFFLLYCGLSSTLCFFLCFVFLLGSCPPPLFLKWLRDDGQASLVTHLHRLQSPGSHATDNNCKIFAFSFFFLFLFIPKYCKQIEYDSISCMVMLHVNVLLVTSLRFKQEGKQAITSFKSPSFSVFLLLF